MSANHLELAHAKLTLSLRVTGRRPDGYHLIEAEMVSVDLADRLEFAAGDGLEVHDGIAWTGPRPDHGAPTNDTNLVKRALKLVGHQAHVVLEKKIPVGAGLGGGSSDAAAVLRFAGLDDLELAARLGADVPFCLRGGRALVGGIGDRLVPQHHVRRSFLVVAPALFVSTASVYAAYDELGATREPSSKNDLERAAQAVEPRLSRVKELIAAATGEQPMLAGSGSTYFVEVDNPATKLESAVRQAIKRAGLVALVTVVSSVEAVSVDEARARSGSLK